MPGLGPPTPAGPAGLGTIPPGILGPPGTMGPWSPGPVGDLRRFIPIICSFCHDFFQTVILFRIVIPFSVIQVFHCNQTL